MTEKVFTKEEWLGTLETLKESYKLLGPVKDGDFHTFMPLDGNKKPDFDYENSRPSPKSVIYPESERMFEYSLANSPWVIPSGCGHRLWFRPESIQTSFPIPDK